MELKDNWGAIFFLLSSSIVNVFQLTISSHYGLEVRMIGWIASAKDYTEIAIEKSVFRDVNAIWHQKP